MVFRYKRRRVNGRRRFGRVRRGVRRFRRGVTGYRSRRRRLFTKTIIRGAHEIQRAQGFIMSTTAGPGTLTTLSTQVPQFTNLTEMVRNVVAAGIPQQTPNQPFTHKFFVERYVVRMYFDNLVTSTSTANGNVVHVRLLDYYSPVYSTYTGNDAHGDTTIGWGVAEPVSSSAVVTNWSIFIGKLFNAVAANRGDFAYFNKAPVNPAVALYSKTRRFKLVPIPNTGTNPGVRSMCITFSKSPRRVHEFQWDQSENQYIAGNIGKTATNLNNYLGIFAEDFSVAPNTNNNCCRVRAEYVLWYRNMN